MLNKSLIYQTGGHVIHIVIIPNRGICHPIRYYNQQESMLYKLLLLSEIGDNVIHYYYLKKTRCFVIHVVIMRDRCMPI